MLSFCNARQITAPEAYIHYSPEVFTDDGEVTNESTRDFLSSFMTEFRDHVVRVLTVIPREPAEIPGGERHLRRSDHEGNCGQQQRRARRLAVSVPA